MEKNHFQCLCTKVLIIYVLYLWKFILKYKIGRKEDLESTNLDQRNYFGTDQLGSTELICSLFD